MIKKVHFQNGRSEDGYEDVYYMTAMLAKQYENHFLCLKI
jgi:hypothetical protein